MWLINSSVKYKGRFVSCPDLCASTKTRSECRRKGVCTNGRDALSTVACGIAGTASAAAKSCPTAVERRARHQHAILDFSRNMLSFMLETASEAMTAKA
jgi:hypothetical protein